MAQKWKRSGKKQWKHPYRPSIWRIPPLRQYKYLRRALLFGKKRGKKLETIDLKPIEREHFVACLEAANQAMVEAMALSVRQLFGAEK